MWSFQTISHSDFRELAEFFVLDSHGNKCQKHVKPFLIESHLTPRGLASWIMDDGGKFSHNRDFQRKGFALNTHGFPRPQVEILRQSLSTRYGLDCWLRPTKNKWVIVISGHDYRKVMYLIGDFLLHSTYHRIPGLTDSS